MKKTIVILLIISIAILCFAGCSKPQTSQGGSLNEPTEALPTTPSTFSKNGIHFTLPTDFSDFTGTAIAESYVFLYSDGSIGLAGIEDSKEGVADLAAYAAYRADLLGKQATQQDGLWTFTYLDESKNEPQSVLCVFYEGQNSYWMVTAYCPEDVFEVYQQTMWEYASSATLD